MPKDQTISEIEKELEQLHEEVAHLRSAPASPPEQEPNKEDPKKEEPKKEEPKKSRLPMKLIALVAVVILAVVALLWWLHARHFEDTDDAQVDGHINGIAARISGTITGVYVEENQFVQAGQVLADLDPSDYRVAAQLARSQVAQAQAQTQAEQPNVPVTQVTTQTTIATAAADIANAEAGVSAAERTYAAALARIRESEANSAKAQADVERYRPLAEQDEVPREQFDQVVATAKALTATVEANRAAAQAAQHQADQARAQLTQAQDRAEQARKTAPQEMNIRNANVAARQAATRVAQAQLDQAQLNLSYTKILAPVGGIVAKRTAEVGQSVMPGQQIVMITRMDDLWVTANFKETQLRNVHPGQSVRIHVDSLGRDYDGYVESMPGATGPVTSLLPPENATGNFVKVVQRLPVRIRFKAQQDGLDRLRPGMSVEPKVQVR